jgi:hypothetical protein
MKRWCMLTRLVRPKLRSNPALRSGFDIDEQQATAGLSKYFYRYRAVHQWSDLIIDRFTDAIHFLVLSIDGDF